MTLLPPLLRQFRPLTAQQPCQLSKIDTCIVLLDALNYALCIDAVAIARDDVYVLEVEDYLLNVSTTRQIKVLLLVALAGLTKRMSR